MPCLPFRPVVVGFGLVLFAAASLPLVLAQGPLQPAPGEEALLGGLADKLKGPENTALSDLRHGKRPVLDPSNKVTEENRAILKKAAQYYAYRLTNPAYHAGKEKNPEQLTINDLVNQAFEKLLLVPEIRGRRALKDAQPQYLKEFGKEMLVCLREVLSKNSKPIVRINATRMVGGLAEAGQEEATDTLAALIKNPNESDAVKLYALRGLKEFFEQGSAEKSLFQNANREAECIKALTLFLARPRPASLEADAPSEEVGAYQYVRREGVRALAATRYPIVPKVKGVEGLSALWLLRVLKKGELDVEPSLSEQAEAAIGLCQLQAKLGKEYNVDYAAYEIGLFLLDYIKAYNDQRVAKVTTLPWRLYTTRLGLGLEQLAAQGKEATGTKGAPEYVAKLVSEAQKALRPLEVDKDANPNDLDEFLRANKPPSKELLRGVKEATLKTAAQ